jgi:hypothetical protein
LIVAAAAVMSIVGEVLSLQGPLRDAVS